MNARSTFKRLQSPLTSLFFFASVLLLICPAQSSQQTRQDRQTQSEDISNYYNKWLNEDVLYLITEEERDTFLALTTDVERDNFIEQFWYRRDSDTRTSANEFKEEHYRRIQYANERFAAGIPGWRTDRGRIYIMYGPPDRRERYPLGGRYDRKDYEGGGITSVFPFERWEYRHLPGLGSDIELEFVDSKGSNLYELTMDAQAKDEFLRVPTMGLTFSEMFAPGFEGRKSWERVVGLRPGGDANRQGILFERARDDPFQKAELMAKLSRAPEIRHPDLRELVEVGIHYDQLPFEARIDWFRVDDNNWLVPLTLSFENSGVSFQQQAAGTMQSRLGVYGRATALDGRTVAEFEEEIVVRYPASGQPARIPQIAVFQHKWLLGPGRYKVELVAKDPISERVGSRTLGMHIPAQVADRLTASPVVLAHRIEPSTGDLSDPLILGPFKVVPAVQRQFSPGDSIGIYFEIYDFRLDQVTGAPALAIEFAQVAEGTAKEDFRSISSGATYDRNRVYMGRVIQLGTPPGRYELVFRIQDLISGQSIQTSVPFAIQDPVH